MSAAHSASNSNFNYKSGFNPSTEVPNKPLRGLDKNGKTLGIVLTAIAAVGILGTAGLIYYTVRNFNSGSSLFKGVTLGGSSVLAVASVGLMGGGIYFIKKTYPKDQNKFRSIREENLQTSFEEFMNKYPKAKPREVFSENELTDKFLEYVTQKGLSYSDVIRSFGGCATFAEDRVKNNPWGLTLGDQFVQRKALERLAIEEIEGLCRKEGDLTPKIIFDHFDSLSIQSPIETGDISPEKFKAAFVASLESSNFIPKEELDNHSYRNVLGDQAVEEYFVRSQYKKESSWQMQ